MDALEGWSLDGFLNEVLANLWIFLDVIELNRLGITAGIFGGKDILDLDE